MELAEEFTLSGMTVRGIGVTPYAGAELSGAEVEGRTTSVYVSANDFDTSGTALGSAVTFRSLAYTVGRFERYDAPLVRLELVR